jgi:hypothetical protein
MEEEKFHQEERYYKDGDAYGSPSSPVPKLPDDGGREISAPQSQNEVAKPKRLFVEIVKDDSLTGFEKRMFWLTLVGVLLAVATALIFYGQFKQMSHQTGILADQANTAHTDSLAAIAQATKQTQAASKAARAAQNSVKAMRDQMVLAERPWVGVIGFSAEKGAETNERRSFEDFTVLIQNTGKTPALKVLFINLQFTREFNKPVGDYDSEVGKIEKSIAIRQRRFFKDHPPPPGWRFEHETLLRKAINISNMQGTAIAPGASYPWDVGSGSFQHSGENGMAVGYYILGKITYHDTLTKKLRITEFCFVTFGGGRFAPCHSGNRMN